MSLIHEDMIKVFLKQSVFHLGIAKCRHFLSTYEQLYVSGNKLFRLLLLLLTIESKVFLQISSQCEMMDGMLAFPSASLYDRPGQIIDNAFCYTRSIVHPASTWAVHKRKLVLCKPVWFYCMLCRSERGLCKEAWLF